MHHPVSLRRKKRGDLTKPRVIDMDVSCQRAITVEVVEGIFKPIGKNVEPSHAERRIFKILTRVLVIFIKSVR